MMLDDLDKRLILELQEDGRQSFVGLARKLYVHEITVRRRLKRLIERNIIRISTIPDLDTIGYVLAFFVGIQVVSSQYLQDVAKQLSSYANVYYLAQVTGQYDFMAIIIDKSTISFGNFLENEIFNISGISRTETFVSLKIHKRQLTSLDTIRLVSNSDLPQI